MSALPRLVGCAFGENVGPRRDAVLTNLPISETSGRSARAARLKVSNRPCSLFAPWHQRGARSVHGATGHTLLTSMAPARRPSSSPARSHPSPRAHVLQGPAGCDELLLIAKTLGLPPLAQPSSSAELVAQITLAANEGKLRRSIQEGRGASLCTTLVHAAFQLIDESNGGTMLVYQLSRSVVLNALRHAQTLA